jgi:hypothetical protein
MQLFTALLIQNLLLKIKFFPKFKDIIELSSTLEIFNYKKHETEGNESNYLLWLYEDGDYNCIKLEVHKDLFDNKGRLLILDSKKWENEWVKFSTENTYKTLDSFDDDIPF